MAVKPSTRFEREPWLELGGRRTGPSARPGTLSSRWSGGALAAACLVAAGCSGGSSTTGSEGGVDARSSDAASLDARLRDSKVPDTATPEASVRDARASYTDAREASSTPPDSGDAREDAPGDAAQDTASLDSAAEAASDGAAGHDTGTDSHVHAVCTMATALSAGADAGSPPRCVSGDLWADIVLGKPDFTQIQQNTVVASSGYIIEGVAVDRGTPGHDRAYYYDSGNNRVLGFDWTACLGTLSAGAPLGCSASVVLGQPSFTSSGCNGDSGFQHYPHRAPASQASLCTLDEAQLSVVEGGSGSSMAVSAGGDLYVTDFFNHRVLRYASPFASGTSAPAASDYWGQTSWSGNSCNQGGSAGPSTLCFSWGDSNNWNAAVDVAPSGDGGDAVDLWVADSGNNRVLRFPAGSKTADLVLGQPSFSSTGPGSGLTGLHDPSGVRLSPHTGRLYVSQSFPFQGADGGTYYQVFVYTPPFSSGMAAQRFAPGHAFNGPMGIEVDPGGRGIWVAERGGGSVTLFDESDGSVEQTISDSYHQFSCGFGFDSAGNVLTTSRGDTPVFAPSGSTLTQFFASGTHNAVTSAGMATAQGVAVHGGEVVACDVGRLLYWDDIQHTPSGAPGKPLVETVGGTTLQCAAMVNDGSGHLFVLYGNGAFDWSPFRVYAYQMPLSASPTAIATLDLSATYPLAGGGSIVPQAGDPASDAQIKMSGIAVDATGTALWLTSFAGSRVLRISGPLTGAPVVDVILGQPDATSVLCNRLYHLGFDYLPPGGAAANTLCAPGLSMVDRQGNLWVSDNAIEINGNMRLLEFDAASFPQSPSAPIYGPDASIVVGGSATMQPAFDSQGQMVVGYDPYYNVPGAGQWFPGVCAAPLVQPVVVTGHLGDYYSMAYGAAFDEQDNLYVSDLDRDRLLVYFGPITP